MLYLATEPDEALSGSVTPPSPSPNCPPPAQPGICSNTALALATETAGTVKNWLVRPAMTSGSFCSSIR